MHKENFVLNEFMTILKSINPTTLPKWGKLNFQQMVEHLSDSVRIAQNSADKIITPEDRLGKMKDFILSDIPFKENTKNVLMSDEPIPAKWNSIEEAFSELENELVKFKNLYAYKPDLTITNYIFGHLNYNEQIHLLHKHFIHHLRQFGWNN